MKDSIMKFLRDEDGLTTVEYAVAGALISVAVIGAFTLLGTEVARVVNVIAAVFAPAVVAP